ncbi:MAG: ribose 5-phosphate isomerase B [Candidatus Omnitrophica bacterium 4484_70.2]|nr:MAG: ribose 5-phosphate isomerase B [Candidatus Omnitrophica bacterium 4484_70.2]
MKIGIGSDHAGFKLKQSLINFLEKNNYEAIDVGTFSEQSCDYPDFIIKLCKLFREGKIKRGIFICSTGIGSAIALNKCKGIRAACVYNEDMAYFSRFHNNSNVIVFGAKYTSPRKAFKLLNIWLETEFEGGRHLRRIKKIKKIEKQNLCGSNI